MRTLRLIVFITIVGIITAMALVAWKYSNDIFGTPLAGSDPEGCTAQVGGTEAFLDTGQSENAALIAAIALQRGLPARAVSIALATAWQESKIRNLNGGDRDSLGLFQQRPSMGWGTEAEIMDPVYAINTFYDALEKVDGYESMDIAVAAQEVQRSADGSAYTRHEPESRALASALTGFSPAAFSCVTPSDDALGNAAAVIAELNRGYGSAISPVPSARQNVQVPIDGTTAGQRLGWSVAEYAAAYAPALRIKAVAFAGKKWTSKDSSKGWVDDSSATTSAVTILME